MSTRRSHRRAFQAILATLACSIVLVAIARWRGNDALTVGPTESQTLSESDVRADVAVATVTRLDSARWAFHVDEAGLLTRCQVGQRWQLLEGSAELTFDTGALVTIFAPADFDILSPTSIRCRRGRVTALVNERGKGFTVETPQGTVVDLGTQFGLDIADDGETRVVVFEGSVDLAPPTGGPRRRLEQGQALLLKNSGEVQRLMSIRRDSYLSDAGRGLKVAPLIANVEDNIRTHQSAKSYQIVHEGLEEDVLSFVDRDHEWNGIDRAGIPKFLIGADYVMPFNDDKFIRGLELTVELTRPATLYIFLDNNMQVPDWLREEFQDTGLDIGLDGATTEWHLEDSLATGAGNSIDFTFSIWQRVIPSPGVVKLGGIVPPPKRDLGFNMYGIAAVDLPQSDSKDVP